MPFLSRPVNIAPLQTPESNGSPTNSTSAADSRSFSSSTSPTRIANAPNGSGTWSPGL